MNKEILMKNENKEKINLNHFNFLIANTKEIEKYLEKFKSYLFEYYTLNISHFANLSKLLNGFSARKNQNFINTPIYQLKLIFQSIIEFQSKKYETMIPDCQNLILISENLISLKKIIEEIYTKHNKLSNLGISKDMNTVSNSIMQYMDDLENKTVEEFVWEKYKKHTLTSNKEKIKNLIDKIKQLEKNLFDYGNEKKGQYFSMIKESDNKIQKIFNDIKNIFQEYISKLKETTKDYIKNLENFEKNLNSISINLEIKNVENVFCSKSDFEFKEKDFNKYSIKILKNKKILLKDYNKDNHLENNNDDNFIELKKTKTFTDKFTSSENKKENILFLTDEDIYEIISRLYKYDLKVLDKSKYDLDKEKEKLLSLEKSNKILLDYSENKEKAKKNLNKDFKQIMELINTKIINTIKNAESFFIALNNYRVKGKLNLNDKFYELILYIYNSTFDLLKENNNYTLGNLMIILSQTFYKENGKEKIYILEGIKSHEIFKPNEFWKNIINNKIEDEIKNLMKLEASKILNQEKKEEIIITKLFAFCSLMKEFNLDKNKISNICALIFEKYKSSQESREQINLFINQIFKI